MSKLDILVKDINKKFKSEIAAKGVKRIETFKIPFSSPRANYMLYGGIPRGMLIEFAGEENSGKTTTALDICKNAQSLFRAEWETEIEKLEAISSPKKEDTIRLSYLQSRGAQTIVYADCENTLDEDWATKLGVDCKEMYILKPMQQSAEEIFDILLEMIDTDEVGLVIIDSLGVMLSGQAYDKDVEQKTYGGIAQALTTFSKKAVMLCSKTGCSVIGVNQVREDMNNPYNQFNTTGGRAWKHNCSVRIMFQKGSLLDEKRSEVPRRTENPFGHQVSMKLAKTKICKPNRINSFYTLIYTEGVDYISDMIDIAIKYGIIQQGGAWFSICDIETGEILQQGEEDLKFQGKAKLFNALKENNELRESIEMQVHNELEKE